MTEPCPTCKIKRRTPRPNAVVKATASTGFWLNHTVVFRTGQGDLGRGLVVEDRRTYVLVQWSENDEPSVEYKSRLRRVRPVE